MNFPPLADFSIWQIALLPRLGLQRLVEIGRFLGPPELLSFGVAVPHCVVEHRPLVGSLLPLSLLPCPPAGGAVGPPLHCDLGGEEANPSRGRCWRLPHAGWKREE